MNDSPIATAFANLDEDEVDRLVQNQVAAGTAPLAIVKELQAGMAIFGERYKAGDFFISDLILSGEIFQQSMKTLEPLLKATKNSDVSAKMVLGTVKGDIHNLGKDILAVMLQASGFEVCNLGIDTPPSVFVEKLKETGASILGLSGLITPSFESMKETVKAVESAALRDKVKIIIGGGVVNAMVQKYAGADAFATDAIDGVNICKNWAKETNHD